MAALDPQRGPHEHPSLPGYAIAHLTTSKGYTLDVRHILPQDATLLVDLFYRMSERTRRLRFFQNMSNYSEEVIRREAQRLAEIDPRLQAALIATVCEEGVERAIAVARLMCAPSTPLVAELAVVVHDDYQREGIGTAIMNLLVQVARGRGITTLLAHTLAENTGVHRLVRKLDLPFTTDRWRGEVTLTARLASA